MQVHGLLEKKHGLTRKVIETQIEFYKSSEFTMICVFFLKFRSLALLTSQSFLVGVELDFFEKNQTLAADVFHLFLLPCFNTTVFLAFLVYVLGCPPTQ